MPDAPVLSRVAAACAALSIAASLHAQIVRYVDDDAPAGGNGTSWEAAFHDLNDALANLQGAPDNVHIRIAGGTYHPDRGTGLRERSFEIDAPSVMSGPTLVIQGGFAGPGAPNPDLNDPASFITVLSGDLGGDDQPGFVNRSDNSYNVVRIRPEALVGGGPFFVGLTIRGGNAQGPQPDGGGLLVARGSAENAWGPWLHTCRVVDNQAEDEGGGMCLNNLGRPSLLDCTFEGNRAARGGGANLHNVYSATLEGTTFLRNVAAEGGGLRLGAQFPRIVDSRFLENYAAVRGGGLLVFGRAELTNCIVASNIAETGGGGLYLDSAHDGPINITNCTVASNSAAAGSGLFLFKPFSADLVNSIFWGESLTGPGVRVVMPLSTVAVAFCDVEGGPAGVQVTGAAGPVLGGGNIDADPRFRGPSDFRVRGFSPCIDAGFDWAVPVGMLTDVAGMPRFLDDPWMPNGPKHFSVVDMGAHEFLGASCGVDCNRDGSLSLADFGCFQVRYALGDPRVDCNADGTLSIADFGCFSTGYAVGCP